MFNNRRPWPRFWLMIVINIFSMAQKQMQSLLVDHFGFVN